MGKYISNGQGWTYGIVSSISDVQNITSASVGDSVFCEDCERPCYYDGDVWTNEDCVVVNYAYPEEDALVEGDVVVTANTGLGASVVEVTKSIAAGNGRILGVVVWTSADDTKVSVAVKGRYRTKLTSSVGAGRVITTSTTSGSAQQNAGTFHTGVFGFTTGSGTTPHCIILARKELY
jgi:hypothetical protein